MSGLKRLISEAHRRTLWQVLGIYLVGSWMVWQVVGSLYDWIGLPDWVPGTALVLLLIGLPIVLATAFVQEGAPGLRPDVHRAEIEGLETTADAVSVEATVRPGDPAGEVGAGANPMAGTPRRPRGTFFTWSRAVAGGVLAFALLGLGATGFMGMRTLGIGPAATLMAKGVMDARDPIVLADFGNSTADERLGEVVTEALRIDLHSSPVIELVSDVRIRETLDRMRRPAGEPLNTELALEVAARDGNKAVIGGEVASVGSGFVLTARVLSTETGQVLAGFRETAAGEGELLAAIDRLSSAIRAKVGESLRSTRASEPLDQVTTSSLDALRLYSRASRIEDREGQLLRAIELLEEAVALDPGFAMAHRKIGVVLSNLGIERERMVAAVTTAYELRDRLNERERGLAVGFYHVTVTGDRRAAISAYRNVLDRYPDDQVANNNLALAYNDAGDYAAAAEVLRPAFDAGQLSPTHYFNLIRALWGQEQADAARARLEEFEREYPQSPMPHLVRSLVHAAQQDWSGAESAVAVLQESGPSSPVAVARALMEGNALDAVQGRLGAAMVKADQLAGLAASLGLPSAVAAAMARGALVEAAMTGDPDRVAARLARLDAEHPDSILPVLDRPHLMRISAWLRVGAVDRAEAALQDYEADVPAQRRGYDRAQARLLGGAIAVARGETSRGIAEMEAALPEMVCRLCGMVELGLAHDRAGHPDQAIRWYTEYLEAPELHRLWSDDIALPVVLQRLAELHETAGDPAKAALYYGRFVSLWEDADPELQPRVESARRRLAALVQQR